jgi:DNA-binding Lrp family transcriptional regulator
VDCRILETLQRIFLLTERSYEIIGRRLQIACDKLWKGLPKLITEGVIRRIGASLNSGKFDFSSTKARNLLA